MLISKTTVPSMPADPYTYYEAENATLGGAAAVVSCDNCSNGNKVGNMGSNGGSVQFNVTVPAAGTYKVKLNYLASDERWPNYSLNGGANTLLKIRLDSGSFNVVRSYVTTMNLNAGSNTIKFSYPNWALRSTTRNSGTVETIRYIAFPALRQPEKMIPDGTGIIFCRLWISCFVCATARSPSANFFREWLLPFVG